MKETICEGFKDLPEICKIAPPSDINSGSEPINPNKQEANHVFSTIVLVVFVMLIFMFVVFLFYRRHVKREMAAQMQHQINEAVSQYFAIAEKGDSKLKVAS